MPGPFPTKTIVLIPSDGTDGLLPQTEAMRVAIPQGTLQSSWGTDASGAAVQGETVDRVARAQAAIALLQTYKLAFSATGSIICNPAVLRKLKVLSGSGLTLVLRDDANRNTDTTIFTASALSVATDEVTFGPNGYQLMNGLYAVVTGTGLFQVELSND